MGNPDCRGRGEELRIGFAARLRCGFEVGLVQEKELRNILSEQKGLGRVRTGLVYWATGVVRVGGQIELRTLALGVSPTGIVHSAGFLTTIGNETHRDSEGYCSKLYCTRPAPVCSQGIRTRGGHVESRDLRRRPTSPLTSRNQRRSGRRDRYVQLCSESGWNIGRLDEHSGGHRKSSGL